MENMTSKTYRDGRVVFKISGSKNDKLDWKARLIERLDPSVGYYCEPVLHFGEKLDETGEPIAYKYDVIVAVPHIEDSIFLLTYLIEKLEEDPTKIMFTYLPNYDEEYSSEEIKCLEKLGELVERRGGIFFRIRNLDTLAGSLNMFAWRQ